MNEPSSVPVFFFFFVNLQRLVGTAKPFFIFPDHVEYTEILVFASAVPCWAIFPSFF